MTDQGSEATEETEPGVQRVVIHPQNKLAHQKLQAVRSKNADLMRQVAGFGVVLSPQDAALTRMLALLKALVPDAGDSPEDESIVVGIFRRLAVLMNKAYPPDTSEGQAVQIQAEQDFEDQIHKVLVQARKAASMAMLSAGDGISPDQMAELDRAMKSGGGLILPGGRG